MPVVSIRVRRAAVGAVCFLFLMSGCAVEGAPSILDPAGPGARRIEGLWWGLLWISAVVFAVTLAMIGYAVLKRQKVDSADADARWTEPFVVVAGAIVPSLILGGAFVWSLTAMSALSSETEEADLVIDVVGHDWWWEVTYPPDRGGVVTANEIHIPAGRRIELRLESDDVIHSFWVPRLQAKTDMIPGKTTTMWIEADEPGTYRGQCAEFCGIQHANMIFYVVAQEPEEFDEWLADQADDPGGAGMTGQEVFLSSTCVGCHTIRGTRARGVVGPDLTHLATRDKIAAGVLDNTRNNLARWILDPQGVKPGVAMPPTDLSSEELNALLDYLEALR